MTLRVEMIPLMSYLGMKFFDIVYYFASICKFLNSSLWTFYNFSHVFLRRVDPLLG